MSLKNPKNVRKYYENLQSQMSWLQFLKVFIFPRALTDLSIFLQTEYIIYHFFSFIVLFCLHYQE